MALLEAAEMSNFTPGLLVPIPTLPDVVHSVTSPAWLSPDESIVLTAIVIPYLKTVADTYAGSTKADAALFITVILKFVVPGAISDEPV